MLEGHTKSLRPLLACDTIGDQLGYLSAQLLQGRPLREDVHVGFVREDGLWLCGFGCGTSLQLRWWASAGGVEEGAKSS